MAGRKNTLSIKETQRNAAKPEPEKFTIEDAFDPRLGINADAYDLRGKHLDLERGIRAVSLLLDQASQEGNEPVDPMLAVGLSSALRDYADDVAHLYVAHERERSFAVEFAEENARRPGPKNRTCTEGQDKIQ